ncbi:glycosyltransferase family 2 protein [Candidatus Nitrospira bockiana]
MAAAIDVLIPTYRRPHALAVTLTSLFGQTFRDFRVVISDQSDQTSITMTGELQAVLRALGVHGHDIELHSHLPRRGMAEQRQFLLDCATAPYALFLDDDVIVEPDVLGRLWRAVQQEQCGFVGAAVIGLSLLHDVRPHEQGIEFWDGPVRPESVTPGSREWNRHVLHNAANLFHLQQRLRLTPETQRTYRVAWVGGCVLYETAKLREAGGFSFWRDLPEEHCGEDVLAQLRVMAKYGGCGLIPSGVYHQQLPTTIVDRRVDAPKVLRHLIHEPVVR